MSTASRRFRSSTHDADRWFREQGLPTFVPLRRWFTDLPRRVAPLVVWVALVGFFLKAFVVVFGAVLELAAPEDVHVDAIVTAVALSMLLVGVAIAWTFSLLLRLLLRHLSMVAGTVVATVVIALCAAWVIADGYEFGPGATAGPVVEAVGIIAVCVLVTGMGGGALVSWASRPAVLCALLIVIGGVAVPVSVVEQWVGPGSGAHPAAVEHLHIGRTTLPLTVNLLKAATLLSAIATLPFVFSAVSEERYRERFFDPIMSDMRRAIVVRDVLDASR